MTSIPVKNSASELWEQMEKEHRRHVYHDAACNGLMAALPAITGLVIGLLL